MRTVKNIGIEIELAVKDRAGVPRVAGRYIEATKEEPLEIDGNLIHKDASMIELAMRPATSAKGLAKAYKDAMKAVTNLIPKDLTLHAIPAVLYNPEELAVDEYASVMGCGASANIYGLSAIAEQYHNNYRYSGTHLNIELKDAEDLDAFRLDCVLGLHSVINYEREHADEVRRRRTLYGMAGEFRLKDFGIEYRTLPSSSFKLDDLVLMRKMVKYALNLEITDKLEGQADRISYAIQSCQRHTARQIWATIHGGPTPWDK